MTPIKICGLTRVEDARLAWELGASALGFVFHPSSPRVVTAMQVAEIRNGLPPDAFCVGVFVDIPPEEVNEIAQTARLDAVQLHGRETPQQCRAIRLPVIKAIHREDEGRLDDYAVATFLLDAAHPFLPGGTGRQADWALASRISQRKPLILAGGLNSATIREAIATVRPSGLDLSSGVESAPGLKDPALLKALFQSLDMKGTRPCLIHQ